MKKVHTVANLFSCGNRSFVGYYPHDVVHWDLSRCEQVNDSVHASLASTQNDEMLLFGSLLLMITVGAAALLSQIVDGDTVNGLRIVSKLGGNKNRQVRLQVSGVDHALADQNVCFTDS